MISDKFKLNFNFLFNIFLIVMLFLGSIVWADSNGVWHRVEDIQGGIFGSDEKSDEAAMLKNLTPQVLYMKQVERIKSLGVLQYKIPYDLSVK